MTNNVFFDYFAFSSKIDSPYSLIQLLNLNEENWLNSKGFHGYRQQLYCGGIHIHFDGQDNMGVCLRCRAPAVGCLRITAVILLI